MKCILLCAGYATRLFPLTENFPKALLKIADKPLLDYIVDEVNTIDEVDEIYLITNDRYYSHFLSWSLEKNNIKKIEVINDNTKSNDDRLGAIGDIEYVIEKNNIDDDLLIVAGDNLFDFKLKDMISFYNNKKAPVVAAKYIDDIELLKRFAVAKIDDNKKVINLVEKPSIPESNVGVYAIYLYPKEIVKLFKVYLDEQNPKDAPGNFVQYLYKKQDVFLFMFDGNCYDVGTHEALSEVNDIYKEKKD